MPTSHYRFLTHWRVPGTPEEVFRIIEDVTDYPRWWPAVWLKVEVLQPGDANGIGKVVRLTSKGWLPYILQWTATTVDKESPRRAALRASGDFEGEGRWTFRADGPHVDIEYLWSVNAQKPVLRYLSFLLRPIFAANHRWAMARGEESLRLELARRHAQTPGERAQIPAPPQPVFLSERRRQQLGLTDSHIKAR
jgi:ribosome-associated toxin RatA of RatAB toxin-antitoxin module